MNQPTTAAATEATLTLPGATLHYELRGEGPLVLLVGAPMDARPFTPLAELLATDHTVLTTDPRGIHRSVVSNRDQDATPQVRADDLAALLSHVGGGPATVLGSSGGAVSVLALTERRPELVETVIAHEPPLNELVEDREQLRTATEQMVTQYLAGDSRGAWELFLRTANIHLPEEVFEAIVGGTKDPQSTADEWYQFARMLLPTTRWMPDLDRLRAVDTRIVVGIGEESTGQLCDRTSRALATRLGIAPTIFPGGHIGFAEQPAQFAVRLREVLHRP